MAVLHNPVRIDPTSAVVYRGLTDLRRNLGRNHRLRAEFITCLSLLEGLDYDENRTQRPVHGFVSLLLHCDARHEVRADGDIILIHDSSGVHVSGALEM